MSAKTAKAARRAAAARARERGGARARRQRPSPGARWRPALWVGLAVAVAVAGLYLAVGRGGSGGSQAAASASASGAGGSGDYPYAVASPGPGEAAPPVNLPSTGGTSVDLAAYRGKDRVLLFFQEGLTCSPCWDQLAAIERDLPKFRALGIGPIVTVTGDPLDLLEQKVQDVGISLPVLSDPDFAVSDSYGARGFGMMRGAANGHTFVLVDRDGKIVWRADYGGEPKYTMFVPDEVLLSELRAALGRER